MKQSPTALSSFESPVYPAKSASRVIDAGAESVFEDRPSHVSLGSERLEWPSTVVCRPDTVTPEPSNVETEALSPDAPLTTRRIDVPGGALVRVIIHTLMRLTIKRISLIDGNLAALRREQLKWDTRLARHDASLHCTPTGSQAAPGHWVDALGSEADWTILYLHGGAFISNWPRLYSAMMGRWCKRLHARALMVDYRLAPEHRYPAAVEDCHSAYRWLLKQGHQPRRIIIVGDSAGANLALVTLQRIHAAQEPMPAFGILLSALVDLTLSSRSMLVNGAADPMFTLHQLAAMRSFYVAPEMYLDPDVSPLFGSFTGLPPLLFQAGSQELLLDDSGRAAARAREHGVIAEVEVWKNMGHVFQALPTPQANAALEHVADFVSRNARSDQEVPHGPSATAPVIRVALPE